MQEKSVLVQNPLLIQSIVLPCVGNWYLFRRIPLECQTILEYKERNSVRKGSLSLAWLERGVCHSLIKESSSTEKGCIETGEVEGSVDLL